MLCHKYNVFFSPFTIVSLFFLFHRRGILFKLVTRIAQLLIVFMRKNDIEILYKVSTLTTLTTIDRWLVSV